jgi:hypothetical protein
MKLNDAFVAESGLCCDACEAALSLSFRLRFLNCGDCLEPLVSGGQGALVSFALGVPSVNIGVDQEPNLVAVHADRIA